MPNQNDGITIYQPLQLTRLAADEDKPSRAEYGVHFISAGYVRRRDNKQSNWRILPGALQAAVSKFNSLAVFVDHASLARWFYPTIRDMAAVTFGPVWNAEAERIDGGVRLYSREDLTWLKVTLNEFLEDQAAGRETPDLGMSAVIFPKSRSVNIGTEEEPIRERHTYEITHAESVDIVFGPGAEGRIREALSLTNLTRFLIPPLSGERPPDEIEPSNVREHSANSTERPREQNNGGGTNMPNKTKPAQEETQEQPAVAQTAPPQAEPQPQNNNQLAALTQQIEALTGTVQTLTSRIDQQEDDDTVQGMGIAPRGGNGYISMQAPEDEFKNAVDWLFGAPGASLPNPQLRSSKFLYEALTGDFEWRDTFDSGRVMLASASPVTLPGLAVDAMNRVIVSLWDGLIMYRWFEMVVAVQPNDGSLQDMNWVQIGGLANLPLVDDGAAYTELTPDDSKETDSVVKHGGYVGVTRKMLRNSDIARIQAVPRQLAVAAVRTRSTNIASIFTDNSGVGPTMDEDSTALFHSNHGNVAATDFSHSAWDAARLECYKQTELGSSKRQALWPKFWLGPPDKYTLALKTFGYGAGPGGEPGTAENDVNVFAQTRPGDPRPVPIAVPDFTDTNDWAWLVDPELAPVIQMSYSSSPGGRAHPVPELFVVMSETGGLMFSADTMPIKVRDEYWYGVATYRGIGKRNVT